MEGPFLRNVPDPVYRQGNGSSGEGMEKNKERFKVFLGTNCKAIRIMTMRVSFSGFFRQFRGPIVSMF
jgi:hypothetical protein